MEKILELVKQELANKLHKKSIKDYDKIDVEIAVDLLESEGLPVYSDLKDNLTTPWSVAKYIQLSLEEKDFEYLIIACKDVVKIAKDKGFYTSEDVRKLWYKKNKAKVLKQSKKWHDEHKEYGKEYGKKYRAENAEKCKKLQAEWRKNNKDKRAEYFHKWYMKKKNKTETRPYNKKEK